MIRWSRHPLASGVTEAQPAEKTLRGYCSNCDQDVDLSIHKGGEGPPPGRYKVPDWAFCTKCSAWLPDIDLEAS